MKNETRKKLEDMSQKYAKYGVTFQDCMNLYNMSIGNGQSEESIIIGLRLAMSKRFNEHEYFTAEDVAVITGETVEQVNKRIDDNKEELMNNGHIVEVSSPLPGLFNK